MSFQVPTTEEGITRELNPARIATLADGVFAIVLTLLVLNITAAWAQSKGDLLLVICHD